MAKYSVETAFKMYNDGTGSKIVVEMDADTSELISIKQYDSDQNLSGEVIVSFGELPLLLSMLTKMAESPVLEFEVK